MAYSEEKRVFTVKTFYQTCSFVTLHPAQSTLWFAVSKQWVTRPILIQGPITHQLCLQQLQNEVIAVTQGAGHVDTFFQ